MGGFNFRTEYSAQDVFYYERGNSEVTNELLKPLEDVSHDDELLQLFFI